MHGPGEGDDVTRSSQNVGAGWRLRGEQGREQRQGGQRHTGGSGHMEVEGRGRQERGWKERERRKMNDRYRRLKERKGWKDMGKKG